MLRSIINKIKRFLKKVKSSIAFYPTVISLAIVTLGVFIMTIDNTEVSNYLESNFPLIIVKNIDTSRTILGCLIGALISLMVFSFSMVMVVLNQAANSFSPRLLPGLISNRKHQIVLGFYLGSIFHCILTLLRMEPADYDDYLPAMGVLFAIFLGMICLGLFIYFIHSISQSVQISKIIYRLYKETHKEIKTIQNEDCLITTTEPDGNWEPIGFEFIGYVRDYDLQALASINRKKDYDIKTGVPEGSFISLNTPSFFVSKKITDAEKAILKNCIVIDDEEWVGEHPNVGVKQIIEIILKAMSPGINDPGTALTGLDYLTNLLKELKGLRKFNCYQEKSGGRVFINALPFEELLLIVFASIRQYVRHDLVIMSKLLQMLNYLKEDEDFYSQQLFTESIEFEAKKVMQDVEEFIGNEKDREYIRRLYHQFGFTSPQ